MTNAIDWTFDLPLQSEEELRLFVRKAWGVEIPNIQVCPNHTAPWRAFADAYFAKDSMAVWKASRGFGGKSFLLAVLGLTEAVTLGADVNILGGSGEQSENVHNYMQQLWRCESAPLAFLRSDPARRHTNLAGGNRIKALMASQASVRGPHPQRLRLDEIDEMALAIFEAAMGQTMESDGVAAQTIASSTHQHADGTMTEVLRRAAERGWPIYEWCYKETMQGWLSPTEVERKRGEVTTAMWEVEYDLQEPSPEHRAIQPGKVKAAFDKRLGCYKGSGGEYIEVEPPAFVCGKCGLDAKQGEDPKCPGCGHDIVVPAQYATGADWGKKKDWTIVITNRMDVTPVRLVAFERCGRLPWPLMVEKFDRQVKRYGSRATHDGTGLGTVVDDLLSVAAVSFTMVGRARSDLLSNYIKAIENGEYVAPMIEFMYNEHKYASVDDVYGRGHLPDSIAAGALAWLAGSRAGTGLSAIIEPTDVLAEMDKGGF